MDRGGSIVMSGQKEEGRRGYLEIICGPMFSGKTSKLVEIYKQYKYCDVPVLVVNYAGDTRYSTTLLSTHDDRQIPCTFAETLAGLEDDPTVAALLSECGIILINEGQFFTDLYSWVRRQVDREGKSVFIAGLDGDFRRETFGDMLRLVPLADKVTKLRSICSRCRDGTPGLFSHRTTSEQKQKMIGASDYIPVCRRCYLSLNDLPK
jgi:thymidine kinase